MKWRYILTASIAGTFAILASSNAYAEDYTAWIGETGYATLYDAVVAANSGDTITLGKGSYSLYGAQGLAEGKELTFVGQGTDKTTWYIGANVPTSGTPSYNADFSLDGTEKATFRGITFELGSSDFLGFVRINNAIFEDNVINGKVEYHGYVSATYKNNIWNCPTGDYCAWTYSAPNISFEGNTFNSSGKVINVYSDMTNINGSDIIINYKDNIVNANTADTVKDKAVLNINDYNRGDHNFIINFSGNNQVNGVSVDDNNQEYAKLDKDVTCTNLFEFNTKNGIDGNSGRTIVNFNGVTVWANGEMQDTSYIDSHDSHTSDTETTSDWEAAQDGDYYTRTRTVTCVACRKTISYPEKGYIVSYVDGVDDAEIFADQVSEVILEGEQTPEFAGDEPKRDGYLFKGWDKEVSSTVTSTVTYTAVWEASPADDETSDNPDTYDNALLAISFLAITACGLISSVTSLKKNRA